MVWIAFWNKFENGFEVKERKEKRELENKRVLKVAKFIFENLPKVIILFWIESIFETIFEFDLGHIWIWIEKGK